VGTLIDGVFPMAEAVKVYGDLKSGELKAVGVLLEYPVPAPDAPAPATRQVLPGAKTPSVRKNAAGPRDQIALGFVGAGNYASSMLLPHLAKLPAANLAHVATTKSLSAVNAQKKFGFSTASTDADSVFDDESLDAIFIVTRHASHAKLVCRALETGKAVYVEKPLALTREETDQIAETVERTGNDRLMVGFNRRFAPLLTSMRKGFGAVASTASTRYLVNAGPLASGSWYLNEEAEGSRFTGEGGHFIDTLTWWADSLVAEVYAVSGPEKGDVQATFRFANGASGTIAYLTGGNARFPKETLDATGGGCSARLDNFKSAAVWTGRGASTTKARGGQDKGQESEMAAFVEAVRTGAPMPIAVDSLLATTRATIAVGMSLLSGRPERV
jgi:predicted dehydrogenase